MRESSKILKECDRRRESLEVRKLLRHWRYLFFDAEGVLIRKTGHGSQLILPSELKPLIYRELHENMGHLGHERVYQLARDRVFWPNMQQEIEHYVTKVCPCLKQRKPHVIHTAPLGSIVTSSPLELICVDFLHLDTCSGGYEYLLVITDHFTRFSQAYPARNKSSTTAANIIFNNFICRFGIPSRILHDQGKEWENKIFEQLEKLCGMTKR